MLSRMFFFCFKSKPITRVVAEVMRDKTHLGLHSEQQGEPQESRKNTRCVSVCAYLLAAGLAYRPPKAYRLWYQPSNQLHL